MKGICPKCGEEKVLTRDHIIPKWIYKRFPWKQVLMKKNLGQKNIQYVCAKCNNDKSNKIDVSHPVARDFWIQVRDLINSELLK